VRPAYPGSPGISRSLKAEIGIVLVEECTLSTIVPVRLGRCANLVMLLVRLRESSKPAPATAPWVVTLIVLRPAVR
jgi:hypothetical protein